MHKSVWLIYCRSCSVALCIACAMGYDLKLKYLHAQKTANKVKSDVACFGILQ
jgi:hypothetical protein